MPNSHSSRKLHHLVPQKSTPHNFFLLQLTLLWWQKIYPNLWSSRTDTSSPIAPSRPKIRMQPPFVLRPTINHVALSVDASGLQNTDYAWALLGTVISLVDYKKFHITFEDVMMWCYGSCYKVTLYSLLVNDFINLVFSFSLVLVRLIMDKSGPLSTSGAYSLSRVVLQESDAKLKLNQQVQAQSAELRRMQVEPRAMKRSP
ncbi:hypothetical protein D8674_026380 [Pyrus ussuriensis x Pyrus communis]|uniref:Uncharacterized protein n=1 Tax=Pyrus ussuriensis x Pyrus communis TaxID=2448454 RepID=A0A5N5I6R6_9ROSA|nr:hypothetical protein D8674_026380 [Pyrus ussuriensis x Pyrus communis]